jgi:type IV secretion system protein VirB8
MIFNKNKKGDEGKGEKEVNESDHQEATDWESCRLESALQSETRAWKVAGCAVAVSVLLAVSMIVVMPLKESIPYVVKVDAAGAVDIVTTLKDNPMAYDDVIDKYWLAKYVRAYESWEFYTAQEDYDFVGLTSASEVAKQYAQLFTGPKAIDQVYGQQYIVKTKIVSVVPQGNGIANVRFEKNVKPRNNPESQGTTSKWIATIGYEYKKVSKMKESQRLQNPLGFNVQSYRIDAEMLDIPAAQKSNDSAQSQPVQPVVPAINAPEGGSR